MAQLPVKKPKNVDDVVEEPNTDPYEEPDIYPNPKHQRSDDPRESPLEKAMKQNWERKHRTGASVNLKRERTYRKRSNR